MNAAKFEWDDNKDLENQIKHHVSFQDAQAAFADPQRVAIYEKENRLYR